MSKRSSVVVRQVETREGTVWEAWGETPDSRWGRLSRQENVLDMVREVRAINDSDYFPEEFPPIAFA